MKEKIKYNNIIKQYKNLIILENTKEHNTNRPKISDHLCRMLIIGNSGSRKTNALFNSLSQKIDIDKNLFVCQMKQNINCQLTNEKVQS